MWNGGGPVATFPTTDSEKKGGPQAKKDKVDRAKDRPGARGGFSPDHQKKSGKSFAP